MAPCPARSTCQSGAASGPLVSAALFAREPSRHRRCRGSEPARFAERVVEERGRRSHPLGYERCLPAGSRKARSRNAPANCSPARFSNGCGPSSRCLAARGLRRLERERYVRLAHDLRRPRHLILLDASREKVLDNERPALDELRRSLDAGELGLEGFQTALRLGGHALAELKRIVFQLPSRDERWGGGRGGGEEGARRGREEGERGGRGGREEASPLARSAPGVQSRGMARARRFARSVVRADDGVGSLQATAITG